MIDTLGGRENGLPMTIEQCKELTRDPLIDKGAHTHNLAAPGG
jgi:hypothetical protein